MPEGPEIRRSTDQLAAALVGHVPEMQLLYPALQPYESVLQGQKIVAISSRSKAWLIHFENELTLYGHNQLYGVWMVRKSGSLPRSNRQLRLSLAGPRQWALLYSCTDLAVLSPEQLLTHPYLSRLGPDVLDLSTDTEAVLARLKDPRFQRRRLHGLLLDQGFLAGLGNYLRSEMLFVARIPPEHRPMDCSDAQLQALAAAALDLPRRSYATAGLTLDPAHVERLKAAGKPRRAWRFWVFAREGQPCHACGTTVQKTVLGGRRLYFCPVCQA